MIDANVRSRLPSKMGENPTSDGESLPYLKVIGSRPLRFSAAPPPPDLTSKPPGSAPPFPPSVTDAAPVSATAPAAPTIKPESKADDSAVNKPANPVSNSPSPILPDDTRPSTRPEDFLPYFQFPGGSNDVTNLGPASAPRPPAPSQLPPSSATYQQK